MGFNEIKIFDGIVDTCHAITEISRKSRGSKALKSGPTTFLLLHIFVEFFIITRLFMREQGDLHRTAISRSERVGTPGSVKEDGLVGQLVSQLFGTQEHGGGPHGHRTTLEKT